jgi:hypothetical protein
VVLLLHHRFSHDRHRPAPQKGNDQNERDLGEDEGADLGSQAYVWMHPKVRSSRPEYNELNPQRVEMRDGRVQLF